MRLTKTKNSRILICLLLLLHYSNVTVAQNMIANNGFESFTTLPSGLGEWWKVSGWNNVNLKPVFAWPYASPDYLSTNGTGGAALPVSTYGTITPFAGNAVMGFVTYYNPGAADFREYISCPFTTPMVVGQTYSISFMLTNGGGAQYCGSGSNHIGIHFSLSPLVQLQHEPINVTPQLDLTTVWWSTTWQQVTFTYVATAPYQYFTIGNFYSDANTQHSVFNGTSTSSYGAYYLLDQVIVQPSTPLPVELLSFSGTNEGSSNHLQWITLSELNNDYFTIERSHTGTSFEPIGRINGAGNSTQEINYSFRDQSPLQNICYYRLKQTDFNGETNYSNVIAVRSKENLSNCILYYDPSKTAILHCNDPIAATVNLISLEGKTIRSYTMNESSDLPIDLNAVPEGMYLLQVCDGNSQKVFKLVNQ